MNGELDALLRQLGLDPAAVCNLTPTAEQALMVGLRAAVGASGREPAVTGPAPACSSGDQLTIDEAAEIMHVSRRWLRRNWRVVGFARRSDGGELRFSRVGAARWQPANRAGDL